MTPGSVSTSRSRRVSFCFCAKLRTCACANLMSSRSRLPTWDIARLISPAVSLNEAGDQPSNFCDNSRTAASRRASTSARIFSTVSRTLASAAFIALASIPRLRYRVIGASRFMCCLRARAGWTRGLCLWYLLGSVLSLKGDVLSFNGLRIDRGAGAASNDQRRPAEEEFVNAVGGTILRQFLEVEYFAHA